MQENLQKELDIVFNKIIAGIGVIYTYAKITEFELRSGKATNCQAMPEKQSSNNASQPSQEVDHLIEVFQNIQKECDHLCEIMGMNLP